MDRAVFTALEAAIVQKHKGADDDFAEKHKKKKAAAKKKAQVADSPSKRRPKWKVGENITVIKPGSHTGKKGIVENPESALRQYTPFEEKKKDNRNQKAFQIHVAVQLASEQNEAPLK